MKRETYQTFLKLGNDLGGLLTEFLAISEKLREHDHKKESNYLRQFTMNIANGWDKVTNRLNKLDTKEMKNEETV